MDSIILVPIILPLVAGFFCLPINKHKIIAAFTLVGMLLTSAASFKILLMNNLRLQIEWINLSFFQINFDLISDHLSALIVFACSLFGLLIALYSSTQMHGKPCFKRYFIYLLLTVSFANSAVLSNNLIILLLFWGIIAIMLYLFISINGTIAEEAAQKSFIIIGCSDFIMLLGIIIVWNLADSLTMSNITIPIKDPLSTAAFIFLMIGAIAKAGAMPFHSWIPDAAEVAPAPLMAFLPAALDKLLGIYLLARLTLDIFTLNYSMSVLLMSIGAVTIIAAVMMALIQKDLKKLLSFHAISQVGYMVLGIGTGTSVGIAGGLFHMLNNTIYKCCLFLCSGSVEYRTKTTKLENLGGLSRAMPVTFITCVIAAFSISGVPPFNGFVSKWMIYQATIDFGGNIWPIFLITAMFGSALTLASFVKVLHSVFLGEKPKEIREPNEVPFLMKIPMIVLALFCVLLGIFAQLPLKYFLGPILGIKISGFIEVINLSGIWNPTLATFLLFLSLMCGIIIYRLGNIRSLKEGEVFIGGETIDTEEVRITGIHFYDTIEAIGFLSFLYKKGKERAFDLYEWGRNTVKTTAPILYRGVDRLIDRFYDLIQTITLSISKNLRKTHKGILTIYFLWIIVGITLLLLLWIK